MANAKVPALPELAEAPADGDLIYVVDVSDTTDDATGSAKKITAANLKSGLATSGDLTTHTGNTENPHSVTKAQVGLTNVEDTALSTWAGSENITTLGTVVTGNVEKLVKRVIELPVIDWTTDLTTGDGKYYLRIPAELNGYNLTGVFATVITAGTTGTTDIQIANVTDSQDMLSTKLTIDSGETDTATAATPAVINTTYDDVATADKLRIDVDAVSTTAPKGLIVGLVFEKP